MFENGYYFEDDKMDGKIKMEHISSVLEERNAYQCKICDRKFSTTFNLKRHSSKSHGLQCNNCDKNFTIEKHLKEHISIVHEEKNIFPCKICDRKFSTQFNLKRHSSKLHGLNCNNCDKMFVMERHLRYHISIFHSSISVHDAKNPHMCKSCEKQFSRRSNLKRHYSKVHEHQKIKIEIKTEEPQLIIS